MRYRFYTCDVFTETRFGGNQLAVLPEAEKLSDHQMQQIAREFNCSETTFVSPPVAGGTCSVRIFTPRAGADLDSETDGRIGLVRAFGA